MICLFEDRLSGRALQLSRRVARVAVHRRDELAGAWSAIDAARAQGHWVALLLDYELGWWLEPSLASQVGSTSERPLLTALIHEQADWGAPLADAAGAGDAPPWAGDAADVLPGVSRATHAHSIAQIHDGIARGDYYQINYTQRLRLNWPAGANARQIYQQLAQQHPAAHGACIQDGTRWVLSFSPELFLERCGSRLTARPMKGTAPRFADPAQDRAAAQALRRSPKNQAENLMIVDLLRNDLGRIAEPGSVRVPSLFDLEAYPSVWTLTSTVHADAPGVALADIITALFPCGSVTGAPKIAAMRAIRALERRARGIYCGSVGWLAPDGDFRLNVAIRTIEVREGAAEFGVGGGIVHDSSTDEEWEECWWKARIVRPT